MYGTGKQISGSTVCRAVILAMGSVLFLHSPGLCDGNLVSLLTKNNPILFGIPDEETDTGAEESALEINPAAVALTPADMLLFSYTASTGGGERRKLFVPVRVGAGFVIGAGLETASLGNTGQFDGAFQEKYASGASEIALGWARRAAGFGIRARQVTEALGLVTADRAMADIGTLVRLEDDGRTCAGIAVNNITLNDERPVIAGAAAQATALTLGRQFLEDRNLFSSLNAECAADSSWSLSAGASYKIQPSETWAAVCRAGYTRAGNSPGDGQGVSAGIAVLVRDVVFSYTYNALAAGGLSHAVGLRYRFAARAAEQAVRETAPVVEQADNPYDAKSINKMMKDLCREALRKIEKDRDALIFSRKAGAADLKPLDESRDVVIKLMIDGKYDDAWTLIKYLYQGYIYLGGEIAAREMLKETENQPEKDNDAKSYQVEFYKRGLREYMKKDMGAAIASMNRYIDSGGQFYREKARQILAAAYLKSGMDSYNGGAVVTAAALWRSGLKNDPANGELARCMKEYIEARCNEHFNEGMVAYSQGDLGTAEALWKSCLEIDPGYERAEKALKRLK